MKRSAQVLRKMGRKRAPHAKRSIQQHTSLDICVPARQREGAIRRWWPSPGHGCTRQRGKIARDVAPKWPPRTSPDIYEKYAIASEWQPNVEGYTPIGSGSPYQDQYSCQLPCQSPQLITMFIIEGDIREFFPSGSIDFIGESRMVRVKFRAVSQNLVSKSIQIANLSREPWNLLWKYGN